MPAFAASSFIAFVGLRFEMKPARSPAVTGLTAGMGLSGDLRNPGEIDPKVIANLSGECCNEEKV